MKKILKVIGIFLLAIVVLITSLGIFAYFSAYPTSMLIRKLFEGGIAVEPTNYAEIVEKVDITLDLSYDSTEKSNTFDLIKPKNATGKEPLIIWVHGGAFVGGDKQDVLEYAVQIAAEGFAVASMNYRLAPEATFPSPLNQLGEMYQYIIGNEKTLGVSADTLILAGDSAGAHIVSQFVMVQNDPAYANQLNLSPVMEKGNVAGMVLLCGPYDLQGLATMMGDSWIMNFFAERLAWAYLGDKTWRTNGMLDKMSIIPHVTKDFPTSFISDGNKGTFTEDGMALRDRLRELGVPVTDAFYDISVEELQHEYQFKMDLESSQKTMTKLIAFLKGI
ncbi:alpha/beta hydrolase [Erysipelothrix sp. HDW6C]|uniref:alpha/beta hydrolase n=1 Tax=Erysipelothrix sp. HDW6C TaxID=2714930 RepID=UPI001407E4C1|nr:alpha/beta hydrolase [Erysipelothrix sp. HDW6C]QIK69875.1 alpha/beta hydrolase [Erysipelothrix sp. HDW6C]